MKFQTQTIILWLSFTIIFFQFSFSQTQVPNGGFENWTGVGSNKEEPTNWNSNKNGGGFATLGPQTCFREDSDVYAGTYSLYLRTRSAVGAKVNGTATTGKIEAPTLNPLDGYIQTKRNDNDFNTPFNGRPDSLVGYFKYNSENGDDGSIAVVLHGDADFSTPDQGGSMAFMIGEANFITPASDVNTWTRFSVPFVYTSTDTPSYFLGILTSSSSIGGGEVGSELWIDELEVIYCKSAESVTISACDDFTSPSGKYTWEASGTYFDTLVNSQMCDSFITVELTVDTLVATATQDGNSIIADLEGLTYQWLDCDNGNAVIEGATSQTFSPSQNGNYALAITKGACVDTSDCILIDAVGVEDDLLRSQISIYPNPGDDFLKIRSEEVLPDFRVELYSLNGKILREKNSSLANEAVLNVSDLAQGMYFVRVYSEERMTVFKWMKE